MKLIYLLLFGLLVMLFINSCKCSKDKDVAVEPRQGRLMDVNTYAQLEFGEDHHISYNNSKEFVLIYEYLKTHEADIYPTIRFHILQLSSMELIYSASDPKGNVKWIDDYVVEVKIEKGIPGPDGMEAKDPSYSYHAKFRKKIKKR